MERLKYEKIQETLRDLSMLVNERLVREKGEIGRLIEID